ncbi:MAG: hypothetical protein V4447_00890 [Pseudomonadota bacterium]
MINQNTLKGVLIILVIFDHNEYAHKIYPLFLAGFSFHVIGFLSLPFLRPAEPLGKKILEKMAFSYYYPFFWIVCGMALLNSLISQSQSTLDSSVFNFLLALYSGNSQVLKHVTQMSLLWFLPSFFSLMLIRGALASSGKAIQTFFLISISLAHFYIGIFASEIRNFIPLGLLPTIYAFPLILIIVKFHQSIFEKFNRANAFLLIITAFSIVKYSQIKMGLSQELGFAMVADYRNLPAMIVNDLEAITGTLMLFQLARFNLGQLIQRSGQNSLQIYLFHAFIALIIFKLIEKNLPNTSMNIRLVISMVITLLLTLLIAKFIMKNEALKRFLFPRSWNELLHNVDVISNTRKI